MHNIFVVKAANDMHNGVNLPDERQKLVAKTLTP
jgi:hypothetical protein